ncbi:MAG: hypothetical protein ACE5HP_07740 [Gemmatimonadota bacterium]
MNGDNRERHPSPGRVPAALAILLWLGLGAGPVGAAVHDEAVLESEVSSVAGGGMLPLQGSHFEEETSYALRLVGALREYEFRKVRADAEGNFSLELAIPGEVRPGAYQVEAVAPDGDVVARLDLTVLEAAASAAGAAEPAAAGEGPAGRSGPMATAEEIVIERDRSGLEWGIIGLLTGLAGGLGLTLLRRGSAAD